MSKRSPHFKKAPKARLRGTALAKKTQNFERPGAKSSPMLKIDAMSVRGEMTAASTLSLSANALSSIPLNAACREVTSCAVFERLSSRALRSVILTARARKSF